MEIQFPMTPVASDGDDEGGLPTGQFRNKNKQGEIYRQLLIDTPKCSLTLALLGHGKIPPKAPGGSTEGSLLVFDFRLTPSKIIRRFKSASFEVTFSDTEGDDLVAPEIYSISPEGTFTINPWVVSQDVKDTMELGGNIGVPQGGVNFKLGREIEMTNAVEYSMSLTGRATSPRGSGEPYHVYWEMEEDKKRSGTPTFLRTAVVVSRQPSRHFTFRVKAEVKAKVTPMENMRSTTVSFFGHTVRDAAPVDDIIIDPAKNNIPARDKVLRDFVVENENKGVLWTNLHELDLRADVVRHTVKEIL
ncbi:hypothetical protein B0T17DRAFT_528621 [Bombardia bombarda]|uniref:Uncharacterized protein n=1 Tax=Bombardia bombarda TaxID=252184 RepID=A0AA39XAU3_9PEZI|nr:hypothetical protein B0T17DRAFT_528621 [Bombardia bombarda]